VLANPPFNDSDWRGELLKDDKCWAMHQSPASHLHFDFLSLDCFW
jgi:type I restriction enzyme M protein